MGLFLVHPKTKRRFEILALDREKNLVTLRGETATFTQKFDKELFKRNGYQLVKEPDHAIEQGLRS